MAYIISTYNKYDQWDRAHSVYKFEVNEVWYAIKEVEMEWGLPRLPQYADRDEDLRCYQVYDTKEDAMQFVRQVRQLAR